MGPLRRAICSNTAATSCWSLPCYYNVKRSTMLVCRKNFCKECVSMPFSPFSRLDRAESPLKYVAGKTLTVRAQSKLLSSSRHCLLDSMQLHC